MAVYAPRRDWLEIQLRSLEAQTYPHLRLYIRDDASPEMTEAELRALAGECIRSFPVEIRRNERNLGSNETFARLTAEAEGEYFAYCDQDDEWNSDKLAVLAETMERERAELVCSDMTVMDENGVQTADSITRLRRHHIFRSGTGLAPELLFRNFAAGCTALVRADTARKALPFCPYMVHDHYLTLCCAERGRVVSLPDKLIRYRIHAGNQTLLLSGVTDRESYGRIRIDGMAARLSWLSEHFSCGAETAGTLRKGLLWARARQRNWRREGGAKTVWTYRRFSPLVSVFEILAVHLSDSILRVCIAAGKRNWV